MATSPWEPGAAGHAAATTVSLAATVLHAILDASRPSWDDAPGLAAQADALRERALELSGECADAYSRAAEALADPESIPADRRDMRMARLLESASLAPLRICVLAADLAVLAGVVYEGGEASRRPDAFGAALLVTAAAETCERLVAVNLGVLDGDPRLEGARLAREEAARAVDAMRGEG